MTLLAILLGLLANIIGIVAVLLVARMVSRLSAILIRLDGMSAGNRCGLSSAGAELVYEWEAGSD